MDFKTYEEDYVEEYWYKNNDDEYIETWGYFDDTFNITDPDSFHFDPFFDLKDSEEDSNNLIAYQDLNTFDDDSETTDIVNYDYPPYQIEYEQNYEYLNLNADILNNLQVDTNKKEVNDDCVDLSDFLKKKLVK